MVTDECYWTREEQEQLLPFTFSQGCLPEVMLDQQWDDQTRTAVSGSHMQHSAPAVVTLVLDVSPRDMRNQYRPVCLVSMAMSGQLSDAHAVGSGT